MRFKKEKYSKKGKQIVIPGEFALSKTISALTRDLRKIYGPHLQKVILYGSFARGDQRSDSDVDIALLLTEGYDNSLNDQMLSCVVEHELNCDRVLSVLDIDLKKYEEWKDVMPFYKNIEKEGIVLWENA
ncbi:MAG: nucleotidyltransferase domain-containing protein [Lachnospiraceae bacterium]|nr:nucleotidyltransferase domain-containing protein [Lachnospiraceae bacterium]